MPKLTMTLVDRETGNETELVADSVEALAAQVPEDYAGQRATVYDEQGSVRGWIGSRADWRAQ